MKTTSKNKTLKAIVMLLAIVGMVNLSFISYAQDAKKKPWVVPEKSKSAANPVKSDAASLESGKALYDKHCKSCHGAKGLGDGPKAKELETPTGDFSADLKGQTDGELFFKTKEGRDDMPSFAKKIPSDNDIWSVINYIKTFAK